MRKRSPLLTSLIVLTALLASGVIAAGCGGDDGDGDSETESTGTVVTSSLTRGEWVEQADEICEQGNREVQDAIESAVADLDAEPTEEQTLEISRDTVLPAIEEQVEEIRTLGAPPEISAQVTTFLDAAESRIGELRSDPTQLKVEDPFAAVRKLATDLGLKTCAR